MYASLASERVAARKNRIRQEAYTRYGGAYCACCDETTPAFLTLDHVGGWGATHRVEIGRSAGQLLNWLKKNDYPVGFQVLCHNCQHGARLGVCPHDPAWSPSPVPVRSKPTVAWPCFVPSHVSHRFSSNGKGTLTPRCLDCEREYRTVYLFETKTVILDHYGSQCSCCGECERVFLTIDHVNGGGRVERLTIPGGFGIGFYKHVIRSGFPNAYRVLCWNCNDGRNVTKSELCTHNERAS